MTMRSLSKFIRFVATAAAVLGFAFLLGSDLGAGEPGQVTVAGKSDRYGDPLPAGALFRSGTIRFRHAGNVRGVVYSPDGKSIASIATEPAIRIWDAESGKPVLQFSVPGERGYAAIAYAPNGKYLAIADRSGHLRLWDANANTPIWATKQLAKPIDSVAFSPEGRTIAAGGQDGFVRLWDAITAEEILSFDTKVRGDNLHCPVAFSSDGSLLACAAGQTAFVYDLKTGREQIIEEIHHGAATAVAFAAGTKYLVTCGRVIFENRAAPQGEHTAVAETKLWDVGSGKLVRQLTNDRHSANFESGGIAVSKNGEQLVSLSPDAMRVWNVETQEVVQTIPGEFRSEASRGQCMAIAPDGNTVATFHEHHALTLWDLKTGKQKLPFPDSHRHQVKNVACSPNEPLIASSSWDGDVRLWDLETGKPLQVFKFGTKHLRNVHGVRFSPDGKFLAACGCDSDDFQDCGKVCLWNIADSSVVWSKRRQGRVTALQYSGDGKRLAIAAMEGEGCKMAILDAGNGAEVATWQGPLNRYPAMQFSADGQEIAVSEELPAVTTWNIKHQRQASKIGAKEPLPRTTSAAFSPDGRWIVVSGVPEGDISIRDAKTFESVSRIAIPNSIGSLVSISPDSKYLATGTYTATDEDHLPQPFIGLYHLETGRQLAAFDCAGVGPLSVTFSHDSKKIISGMRDGTVLVWEVSKLE